MQPRVLTAQHRDRSSSTLSEPVGFFERGSTTGREEEKAMAGGLISRNTGLKWDSQRKEGD